MPRRDNISKNSKCLVRLPIFRDRSQPYETQVLKIVNKVFRRDVPQFGNCDWGQIEFLCWGYQVWELKTALEKAGHEHFAAYAVHVEKLTKWPAYPINCTGNNADSDGFIGIDSKMSYPNLIADQREELESLTKKVEGLRKTYDLLTNPGARKAT